MFNYFKKKAIESRVNDELLYEYVIDELEKNIKVKGLWAKAYANSDGNDNKIEPLYMQYRVQAIKDMFSSLEIIYDELPKQKLFDFISNGYNTEKLKKIEDEKLKKIEYEKLKKIEDEEFNKIMKDQFSNIMKDQFNMLHSMNFLTTRSTIVSFYEQLGYLIKSNKENILIMNHKLITNSYIMLRLNTEKHEFLLELNNVTFYTGQNPYTDILIYKDNSTKVESVKGNSTKVDTSRISILTKKKIDGTITNFEKTKLEYLIDYEKRN